MLADDARPAAAVEAEVEVVEQLLHLAFDEAVLLLDHEDVLEPARERADAHRLPRPGHADLVDADAPPRAGDRKSDAHGESETVRVALGGPRINTTTKTET